MSQSKLLIDVVHQLEVLSIPYMLTGSHASSLQGVVRLTHDIDLVVVIKPSAIVALQAAFPEPDFFLDDQAAREAVARDSHFNLMHLPSGDKVDFWMLTADSFDKSRFARRRAEDFEGVKIFVSTPEDTILMKLRWSELSGGSEKQLSDARGVFEFYESDLDMAYMNEWAKRIEVQKLWEQVKKSVR